MTSEETFPHQTDQINAGELTLVLCGHPSISTFQAWALSLSLVPSALCNEYGDMRKGNKPTLIEKLAVFPTTPLQPVDHELIDGNEAIYHKMYDVCMYIMATKYHSGDFCHNLPAIFLKPLWHVHCIWSVHKVFRQVPWASVKSNGCDATWLCSDW